LCLLVSQAGGERRGAFRVQQGDSQLVFVDQQIQHLANLGRR
jgi:hypothetical protein